MAFASLAEKKARLLSRAKLAMVPVFGCLAVISFGGGSLLGPLLCTHEEWYLSIQLQRKGPAPVGRTSRARISPKLRKVLAV